MKIYELERRQEVVHPIDEVFAFFERPENLAAITPPELGFVILTPSPIRMQTGTVIDYSIRIGGLRHYWTTIISDYDPPHRFVDVQLRGPYRFWHHTHTFRAENGGTHLTDRVRYGMPFGLLGRLVHLTAVQRQLKTIFDYRQAAIARRFGGRD